MRTTSDHLSTAKKALAEQLEKLPLSGEQRRDLSKGIAKFTAMAVREDRVHRNTTDMLVKLCDVFFNGRQA